MRVRTLLRLAALSSLLLAAPTAPAAAPTRTPRPVSLRECIELALRENLGLQIEHLTVDIAGYNLSGSYGAYIPEFAFRAQHDYVSQPSNFDPQKVNVDYPYDLTTGTLRPELSGRLPLGLEYGFGGLAGNESALTDFRSNPDVALNFPGGLRQTNNSFAGAQVTVTQHLLRDFWIDQYREKIRLRRKDLKSSQESLRFQIMKTVLAVELSYYDLAAARQQARVQEKSLELKQQLVTETRRRVEVGDLPPLDMEQAETQLQNALTAVAQARGACVDRQNALKILVTDDFKGWVEVELEPADALLAFQPDLSLAESFACALKGRPDLAEARLLVEKRAVSVQFRQNQLFPNLDFVGRYGGQGVQPALSSAISDVGHFRYPEYFYGVVMSFPLGNLSERNNYRASKAAKQMAELQLKQAEQEILRQVADCSNQVEARFPQVGSTRKARSYAEAALAAEQKKLANGLSTTFVVLQLQEILTSARTAEAQALTEYNKALAQLQFAEGRTLDQHRLALDAR
jgi:outer membrane protein TolC